MSIKVTTKVTTETITRKTYSDIEVDGKKYILIDMLNENNWVTDTIIRDENGYYVDDPIIVEAIVEIINNHCKALNSAA